MSTTYSFFPYFAQAKLRGTRVNLCGKPILRKINQKFGPWTEISTFKDLTGRYYFFFNLLINDRESSRNNIINNICQFNSLFKSISYKISENSNNVYI